MKKVYTLLAAACVTASAMAIPMKKIDNVVAKTPAQHSMAEVQRMSLENPVIPGGKMKATDKITGQTYAVLVYIEGPWELMSTETGEAIPFEEYPYYNMHLVIQQMEGNDFYQMDMQWPGYGALNDECWEGNSDILNDAKVKEIYGDKAYKPMSYEDYMSEYVDKDGKSITQFITLPGFYMMPCMLGSEIYGSYASRYAWTVDGQTVYPVSAIVNSDYTISMNSCCTLNWTSFDPVTTDIEMEFAANYTNAVGGSRTGAKEIDPEGSAVILGFAALEFPEIGQVHIFNAGRQEDGDPWTYSYDTFGTQPLNYFYLCFCDASMGYQGYNSDEVLMQGYEDDELPVRYLTNGTALYGAPSYRMAADMHMTYLAGAIWAPENAEYPYGLWSMKMPDNDGQQLLQTPEAYNLIVAGYGDAPGAQDGFYGMWEGYRQYAMPGATFVGIGDKTKGLNFAVGTYMNNNLPIYGEYTGDIYYHNIPEQWLKWIDLPAVGTGNYNALDNVGGVKDVVAESNAPVVSTTYYNFQGQRIDEPTHGMYIVRTVKADGTVKATKVAR